MKLKSLKLAKITRAPFPLVPKKKTAINLPITTDMPFYYINSANKMMYKVYNT